MAKENYIFTSESVSEGHPDKVCDIISDSVLDLYLSKFAESRVACETLVTTNTVVVAGEIRGPEIKSDEIENLIRAKVKDIGYEQEGFHWKNLKFTNYLHSQSQDIAVGVDSLGNKDEGAGDQGIMFGYACNETKELMPAPISYAHKVLKLMAEARKSGKEKLLGPDSKSQFSVIYEKGKPKGISSIVVSTQHHESIDQEKVKEIVRPYVLSVIPKGWMCDEKNFYVNPTTGQREIYPLPQTSQMQLEYELFGGVGDDIDRGVARDHHAFADPTKLMQPRATAHRRGTALQRK
ncbi:MAG: hypothetical protein RL736_1013 [Pseudomonadota bacterium]